MKYLDFFIEFNLYLLLPTIIFGLLFHLLSTKSEINILKRGWLFYVLFSWIGTPIHEFSHYIMCLIFRFKVNEVKLFRPIKGKKDGTLGYVNYEYNTRSFYQKIGNFFVGIAPMIGGSLSIYGLFRLLLNPLYQNLIILDNFSISAIFDVILSTKYDIFYLIIFVYLTINIAMHMSISSQDLKNAIYGGIWLEILLLIISIILTITNISLLFYIIQFFMILIFCFMIGFISNIFTLLLTNILSN